MKIYQMVKAQDLMNESWDENTTADIVDLIFKWDSFGEMFSTALILEETRNAIPVAQARRDKYENEGDGAGVEHYNHLIDCLGIIEKTLDSLDVDSYIYCNI